MNLKEWMNLKALQILELITYIAEKVAFWKQANKKTTNDTTKKEETKNGK